MQNQGEEGSEGRRAGPRNFPLYAITPGVQGCHAVSQVGTGAVEGRQAGSPALRRGVSAAGSRDREAEDRGPPDRLSGPVFSVGFKLQAWRLQTEDRKPSRIFQLPGCTSKGPMLPAFPFSFFVRECFVLSKADFQQCGYFRLFFSGFSFNFTSYTKTHSY